MNFLEFSPTQDVEEREWISVLHEGIPDNSLLKLTNSLPPNMPDEVLKLITDLNAENSPRKQILTKLISLTISYTPINRAEYLWYLQFTVAVLLLQELPVSLCIQQGNLLTRAFAIPTTIWDADPLKIHYFASHLYDMVENDKNLIFVVNQIETRSSLGFYLSMSLLWKSIYRLVDEDKPIFRLYPPSDLMKIIAKISAKKLNTNFDDVLNFILLHSKISTLIFHRKKRHPEYKCYEEFFVYDMELVNVIKEFLEQTLMKADSLWRKDSENLNYLTMIECLQVNISEFDTLTMNLHSF